MKSIKVGSTRPSTLPTPGTDATSGGSGGFGGSGGVVGVVEADVGVVGKARAVDAKPVHGHAFEVAALAFFEVEDVHDAADKLHALRDRRRR